MKPALCSVRHWPCCCSCSPPAVIRHQRPAEPQRKGSPPRTPSRRRKASAILEKQLGAVDEATGNVMSYGYEGPLTLDGVDYYNYRVSWLVDGDHLSYLTNYLVSTDGLVVQEYLPETD